MPAKGDQYGGKAINALAGAAAAYVARKVIILVWTKLTGRKPPGKAEDPNVAIGEALAYTMVLAAGVAVARVLVLRLVNRQSAKQLTTPAE